MNKEKISKLWYMIEKECQRNSLMELLEYWDLTIKDWKWLENNMTKMGTNDENIEKIISERDAALKDLEIASECRECAYIGSSYCNNCDDNIFVWNNKTNSFKWRGKNDN